jgi:hypothetical protein
MRRKSELIVRLPPTRLKVLSCKTLNSDGLLQELSFGGFGLAVNFVF